MSVQPLADLLPVDDLFTSKDGIFRFWFDPDRKFVPHKRSFQMVCSESSVAHSLPRTHSNYKREMRLRDAAVVHEIPGILSLVCRA